MHIATCPECGHDINLEDLSSDQLRLILAAGSLIATVAIQGMLMELPEYQDAREGFNDRVGEITEAIHQTVDHLTEWGSAFDE